MSRRTISKLFDEGIGGIISSDYTEARGAGGSVLRPPAGALGERKSITTFGPYSPRQAVTMKRMGIGGIIRDVYPEAGRGLAADLNRERIAKLLAPGHEAMWRLIRPEDQAAGFRPDL